MDYITPEEKIMRNMAEAYNDSDLTRWQNFKRFRLNIDISGVSVWMLPDKWESCNHGRITATELAGYRCYAGLDLSEKLDLSALSLVFPPQKDISRHTILMKFYCPENQIDKRSTRDSVSYRSWVEEGLLTPTPGDIVNEDWIKSDIVKTLRMFRVIDFGIDPYRARQLVRRLEEEEGLDIFSEVINNYSEMNETCLDFQEKVISGAINHGGNAILTWNMLNVVMKTNYDGWIRPDKRKAPERIDGAVATLLAWHRLRYHEFTRKKRDFSKMLRVIT
jgi:phage terminase large subunit-like protein